jgi:hypothetical protein
LHEEVSKLYVAIGDAILIKECNPFKDLCEEESASFLKCF